MTNICNAITPKIDEERVVKFIYGPRGLISLDSPTKAKSLVCYGCGKRDGYLNLPWNAWCCSDEKCWGPLPKEEAFQALAKPFEASLPSLKDLGVPDEFVDASFLHCRQIESKKAHFKNWAKNPKGFLMFSGNAGSGKTYLACAILQEYASTRRRDFKFINVSDFYVDYRTEMSQGGSGLGMVTKLSVLELLVLDDLGQRTPTDSFMEFLYIVINKRLNARKATIITTNLTAEVMEKKLGEALTSRIVSGEIHEFEGKDRRISMKGDRKVENLF